MTTTPKPRCSAHKKDGTPCGRWPLSGSNVCPKHGGSAPQVRKRAQERIFAAADSAAGRLIEFMNDKKVPYSVRLAATRDLLDRGIGTAAQTIKLGVEDPWADLLSEVMDSDVFEDIPADTPMVRRGHWQRRITAGRDIPFPAHPDGVSQDEDDEDPVANSRTTYNNRRTIPGHVVRDWPEPTPEQEAAAARGARRARLALFAVDGEASDEERSEYSEQQSEPMNDPSRPPRYVREAMESEDEDWQAGEGGRRSGRATFGA